MEVDQATRLRSLVEELKTHDGAIELSAGVCRDGENRTARNALARTWRGLNRVGAPLRTVAITSGKGGVGKTNLTVNLAIALSHLGRRVLILDGDLGLANVDVLLDIHPRHNLQDVVEGRRTIEEIVLEGPDGVRVVPGGSGLYDMANLDDHRAQYLVESAAALDGIADTLLIDTAAGISANVVNLVQAAGEAVVVASPEPTSITDAYGLIKVIASSSRQPQFRLVINMAGSVAEADEVARRVVLAARQFLGLEIDYCGMIPTDANVVKAVRRQTPFLVAYPKSAATLGVTALARRLVGQGVRQGDGGGIDEFFRRVMGR
ncbi:MAG: MinD/ParA family protein [Chloroflexota bacterium]